MQEARMSDTSEYADDVTDLRTAQRMIAQLRRQVVELVELSEPAEGEVSVFLDEEHMRMLQILYERCRLFEEQDEEWEFIDAVSEFVSGWIDVQWDTVRTEDDPHLLRRQITPSA